MSSGVGTTHPEETARMWEILRGAGYKPIFRRPPTRAEVYQRMIQHRKELEEMQWWLDNVKCTF